MQAALPVVDLHPIHSQPRSINIEEVMHVEIKIPDHIYWTIFDRIEKTYARPSSRTLYCNTSIMITTIQLNQPLAEQSAPSINNDFQRDTSTTRIPLT